MTNLEKWRVVTSQLETPDNFVDLAWYAAVLTALERRVFYGDLDRPHFINGFFLFVGKPSLGKGTIMREAAKLISKGLAPKNEAGGYEKDPITGERRRLFQQMPDTVTFEQLISVIAKSTKTLKYGQPPDEKAYAHASVYFHLEELSSLLKPNKSEDVGRFLLTMYDCAPYTYSTKHHGTFVLKQPCLNFMAGTQVDYIRKAEQTGLLGEGLFSRFIICYEKTERQAVFEFGNLTDEQKQFKDELALWLANLSSLFGPLQYADSSVSSAMQKWWEDEKQYLNAFGDSKLANYFARRKDHVKRLAAAIHFSDSMDMIIPISAFRKAADLCRKVESTVIQLAALTGRNALFPLQERILAFIEVSPRTNAELMELLRADANYQEATEILNFLQKCNKITYLNEKWQRVRSMSDE